MMLYFALGSGTKPWLSISHAWDPKEKKWILSSEQNYLGSDVQKNTYAHTFWYTTFVIRDSLIRIFTPSKPGNYQY